MSSTSAPTTIATIGIDLGKNSKGGDRESRWFKIPSAAHPAPTTQFRNRFGA
jgi:hypothetical protein